MMPIHTTLRQIGNSQGIVIPKPMLAQVGFEGEVDMSVEGDAIVLRKHSKDVRVGWGKAARDIAAQNDDDLVMGEFGNEGDSELAW